MTGYLILGDGREHPLHPDFTVGRVQGCDLVIDDPKASRRHLALRIVGSVVEVEDLGSSNGTLLNGKPVQRRLLRDGDVIRIGRTELTFRERGGQSAAAEAVGPGAGEELDFGEEPSFADEAPAPAKPAVPGPAPRAAAPSREVEPSPPPKAPAGEVETLEFLDEVVQVRAQPKPPAKPAPGAGRRGASAAPARGKGILQFNKQADRKNLVADDMAQMGGPMRLLLVLVALAVAVVIGYLAMTFAQ